MSEWPENRIKQVVELWNAGKSFRQIAKEVGITRSMVSGFKARHGRTYGMQERVKPVPKPKPIKKVSVTPRAVIAPLKPISQPHPMRDARCSIFELTSRTCRWPIGEPNDMLFCGQYQKTGSSYCGHHHTIAHVRRQDIIP